MDEILSRKLDWISGELSGIREALQDISFILSKLVDKLPEPINNLLDEHERSYHGRMD